MKQKIKAYGRLQADKDALRILVGNDLIYFYKTLVEKHFHIVTHYPMHGGHITITNTKLHKNFNFEKAKDLVNLYKNKQLEFFYDPYIIVGGRNKPFKNFYMLVEGIVINSLAKYMETPPPPNGFHITVANTKGGVKPFFGKMIEIKQ